MGVSVKTAGFRLLRPPGLRFVGGVFGNGLMSSEEHATSGDLEYATRCVRNWLPGNPAEVLGIGSLVFAVELLGTGPLAFDVEVIGTGPLVFDVEVLGTGPLVFAVEQLGTGSLPLVAEVLGSDSSASDAELRTVSLMFIADVLGTDPTTN